MDEERDFIEKTTYFFKVSSINSFTVNFVPEHDRSGEWGFKLGSEFRNQVYSIDNFSYLNKFILYQFYIEVI